MIVMALLAAGTVIALACNEPYDAPHRARVPRDFRRSIFSSPSSTQYHDDAKNVRHIARLHHHRGGSADSTDGSVECSQITSAIPPYS